ncbi:MAG: hypothetical protein WCK31_05395, partial [bacterium]
MATLSDTTKGTRRFLIGFGVFVVLAIIINTCGRFISLSNITAPLLPSISDNLFGDLPLINIPSLSLDQNSTPVFSLETQTGKLPVDLPKIAYVYKYKEPRQTLTSRDEAITQASALGFTSDPVELNSTELRWLSASNKSLVLDKISKSVLLETDFTKQNDAKTIKPFSSYQANYESIVKSYGLSNGAFNSNYTNAKTSSNYLIYDENYKLRKSKSPDTTEVVVVNVYKRFQLDPSVSVLIPNSTDQVDPEKLTEVLGMNPKLSDTRAVMGIDKNSIYYLSSKNWYVEPLNRGKYNTISVSESWNTVQSGKGSLVYLKKLDNDYLAKVTINYDVKNNEVNKGSFFIRSSNYDVTEAVKMQNSLSTLRAIYIEKMIGMKLDDSSLLQPIK